MSDVDIPAPVDNQRMRDSLSVLSDEGLATLMRETTATDTWWVIERQTRHAILHEATARILERKKEAAQ
jgi:hypothetical protein